MISLKGGLDHAATATYKRLGSLLAEKCDTPYATVMGWLCYRLSFSHLRSSILHIHGARSTRAHTSIASFQGGCNNPVNASQGLSSYILCALLYIMFFDVSLNYFLSLRKNHTCTCVASGELSVHSGSYFRKVYGCASYLKPRKERFHRGLAREGNYPFLRKNLKNN